MPKHIGTQRKDGAQKRIKAKIKVLEKYVHHGIPEGAYIPASEASFRLWKDETLGLEKIGSPNTLNRAYNRSLKQRVAELIKELANKNKRKARRPQLVTTLRNEKKIKDQLIRELTSKWHSTRHELEQTQRSNRRLSNRIAELEQENSDLIRKLNAITGLKSV
jgi:chromosome segregation ATPase